MRTNFRPTRRGCEEETAATASSSLFVCLFVCLFNLLMPLGHVL